MKINLLKISFLIIYLQFFFTFTAKAQFSGFTEKLFSAGSALASKALGVDKILKQPAAITTSFEDVDQNGLQLPDFKANEKAQSLYLLPKAPQGGFVLCEGFYEMSNKSYCLMAGTFAPSSGDGYMYAPIAGPKDEIVTTILKNAEKHPDVHQHDIQMLLWAIIARTKFNDYSGTIKLTAITLLSPRELLKLEGGALGILPGNLMEKAKSKLPEGIQTVFEAENKIRKLVASGNYTYEEMEKYAIIAGFAPQRADFPRGVWTLHPEGYYIRYFPSGYSTTKVQVYVPKALLNNSKGKNIIYDATNDIACPANVGSQRLAQTNEPLDPDYKQKLKLFCKEIE